MTYRTEFPDYRTAHRRVVSERGKAIAHNCVDCSGPAAEWSYDHADEAELEEVRRGRTLKYSAFPDHYDPRCRPCHIKFDRRLGDVESGSVISEKCGTYAGVQQHNVKNTPLCPRCRLARNEYMRMYRARSAG